MPSYEVIHIGGIACLKWESYWQGPHGYAFKGRRAERHVLPPRTNARKLTVDNAKARPSLVNGQAGSPHRPWARAAYGKMGREWTCKLGNTRTTRSPRTRRGRNSYRSRLRDRDNSHNRHLDPSLCNIDVSLFFCFHCSSFAHSRLRFQEPVICYYSSTAAVLLHKLLSTASPVVFHRTTYTACFQP